MKALYLLPALALITSTQAQVSILSSDFNNNTGATILSGNANNTAGSNTLTISWNKHPSVTNTSNLTAISTGNSGTASGFAQTQNGTATYANPNNIFIGRNHNLDTNRTTSKRGYAFTFTINDTWELNTLTAISGHTNDSGNSDQAFTSDLNLKISGTPLATPITLSKTEDYNNAPAYHNVGFDLSATTLTPGTYTIEIYQSNMTSGGAYATFDGINLTGENGDPAAPTITSFTADKTYATQGTAINLSWETTGAQTLTISPNVGNVTPSTTAGNGTTSITINSPQTYTLTATNPTGATTATLDIQSGPPRPNIVFFLVDDMGPQDTSVPFNIDANGNPVSYNFNTFYKTPNMEALAADGMRFTNAYAQTVCSPTRTGLMTGRNSTRHAVSDWVGGGGNGSPSNWRSQGLDATDTTLPQILSASGYRTIHIGKGHFGSNSTGKDPLKLGFDINIGGGNFGHPGSFTGTYGKGGSHAVPHLDAYHNTGTFLTKALATEANKAIENAKNEGRPFFLNMSFYAVHAPFTTNPDATGDYSAATNANHAKYATMLEGMDLAIGQIRQKLIDLGIAENTLIVFIGDNGSDAPAIPDEGLPNGIYADYPMRGKKGSKYEGGSRIPFIACWAKPDANNAFQQLTPIPANTIETDIVTSWDIPNTFLAAANIPTPQNFGEDSHNLLPYFSGTPGTHRPQQIVMHYPHNNRSDYFSFIRKGNMKLIYNYQNNNHQLYNLQTDPTESNNLSTTNPEQTNILTRALAKHLSETWGTPGPLIPTIASTAPNGNVVSIPNNNTDADNDDAPDTTEDPNLNGLTDPGETNPDNPDTDADGTNDGAETKLGLNPLDPNSHFHLTPTQNPNGTLQLTWPSAPGTTYTIKSSTTLTTWPTTITTNFPASAGSNTTHTLTNLPTTNTFYRIELE